MSAYQWCCLLMAGVSASLGQFSITTAYKYAPAKEISVFDYTQVVFAALLGIFFLVADFKRGAVQTEESLQYFV